MIEGLMKGGYLLQKSRQERTRMQGALPRKMIYCAFGFGGGMESPGITYSPSSFPSPYTREYYGILMLAGNFKSGTEFLTSDIF
jgi:hypothetical protein